MKKQLNLAIIIGCAILAGCSSMGKQEPQSLVGKWEGLDASGSKIELNFINSSALHGKFDSNELIEFNAGYKADYSVKPHTIDMADFDNKKLEKLEFKGIFIFEKKGGLLMYLSAGPTGQVERRTEFRDEAISLKRISE